MLLGGAKCQHADGSSYDVIESKLYCNDVIVHCGCHTSQRDGGRDGQGKMGLSLGEGGGGGKVDSSTL